MKYITIAATALALSAGAASAATIYNEAIDGDLKNSSSVGFASDTFFDLTGASTSTILGSLGAGNAGDPDDGVDEFDIFQFSVSGDFTVDLTDIMGTSLAVLYTDGGSGSFSFTAAFLAGTDIFASLGTLAAGTYAMGLVALGNGGTPSYSLSINTTSSVATVPLPAGLPLLAAGLFGLGALARIMHEGAPDGHG